MSKTWLVVQEKENGKQYAHAWPVTQSDNLIAVLSKFKNAFCVTACESKKEAYRLVELYRELAKANGTYMFD